jgi:hypothetical protein
MFCTNCGEQVSEGKAFCKNCGSPVGSDVPPVAESPKVVPPPVPEMDTGVAASASVTPPAFAQAPPPPSGYEAGPRAYPAQPPVRRGNGGLIAGIIVAVVIVVAAAAVAAVLLLRSSDGSASTTAAQVTTTSPQTTSTVPASSTTATGAPASTSTTGAATTVTSGGAVATATTGSTTDPTQEYLTATDALVALLQDDDARIPQLATKINATAPHVPVAVRTELEGMLDRLDPAVEQLAAISAPAGFQQSKQYLDQAAGWMATRIDATIKGINAMYDSGTTAAARPFFKQGQTARDKYRAALQQFHEAVPID